MATSVNSTSSNSYSLLAKTGAAGLVSGMDTDELVYKLTATTRSKIAAQGQKTQLLQWKQEAYRSITKKLTDFQSKYFDVLSSTYVGSEKFFNTVSASSSATSVVASATANASTGSILINSITNLATKQSISSGASVSAALSGTLSTTDYAALASTLHGASTGNSMGLTLDGKLRTITFDEDFLTAVNADPTEAGFQKAVQALADEAFGVAGTTEEQKAANRVVNVSVSGGKISFAASGSTLTTSAINGDTTALTALGLTSGMSNVQSTSAEIGSLKLKTTLSTLDNTFKFTINNTKFEFASTTSLSSMITRINSSDAGVTLSYSNITDKFTIQSDTEGSGANIVIDETQGNLLSALGLTEAGGAVNTPGENAVLMVNGTTITRSTNDINISGVNLKLTAETGSPVTVTMTENSSNLSGTLEKFVEDYNSLISSINSLIREEVNKDYKPLTDEQKKEMTTEEITAWETKAKSGILRGDGTLRALASKLTNSLFTKTGTSGTTLYEMGIASKGYDPLGKIGVDTDKLKTALSTNIGEIVDLFTADGGLSDTFDELIDSFAKTSGPKGSRGILVDLAGVADTLSATQNSLFDELEQIGTFKGKLTTRLESEEKRYWAQFTAMETALSRLNAQSAIITSFSSGS